MCWRLPQNRYLHEFFVRVKRIKNQIEGSQRLKVTRTSKISCIIQEKRMSGNAQIVFMATMVISIQGKKTIYYDAINPDIANIAKTEFALFEKEFSISAENNNAL